MAGQDDVPLPNLRSGTDLDLDFAEAGSGVMAPEQTFSAKGAHDLEHVFDVPVNVSAVLGRTRLEVGELLRLGPGTVLELDRASARPSTSTSTTAWWPAARWSSSTNAWA